MSNPVTARQLTLFDLEARQEKTAYSAANPKTFAELVAGDYLEWREADGSLQTGWCAARHPVDGSWQIQRDQPWVPAVWTGVYQEHYRFLWSGSDWWRYMRHDAEWSLTPDVETVVAWMRETASTLKPEAFYQLSHGAQTAWPVGAMPAWRQRVHQIFTELAIQYVPVARHLRENRKQSNAGSRIWSCPPRIQQIITDTVWPLPGEARLGVLQTLRWTRAEDFHDPQCVAPDALRGFNRSTASIYEDYYRWAIIHAETPRQLLELCDAWGSNPVPAEGGNKACVTNETP